MSFTISYIKFFKVRAVESVGMEPVEEVSFIPSKECLQNLNKHRLVFKPKTGGFDILYQTNPYAADPVIAPISKRIRFSFGMIISDANFFKKYEPDFDGPPQLYFDNLDSTGNILAGATEVLSEAAEVQANDSVKIFPLTFVVNTDLTIAPTPNSYLIKDKFNPATTLQTVNIDNPLGLNNVSTKLNDLEKQAASYIDETGPYLLESDSGQPPQRTIYLDDQLVKQNLSGIADIYWDSSQSNAVPNGNEYQIRFKLR